MSRRLLAWMASVALVLAAAGADWAPAHRRGDLSELRRRAMNGGARDVIDGLRSGDRAAVLGAIAGAGAAPDAWELLGPLAELAGGWDRSTAAPAAHAAARIARAWGGAQAIALDVPDDRLAALAEAWRALAGRADRWTDVRVHALEVAVRLDEARAATAEVVPDPAAGLLPRIGDADPEVRRAALELMPVPVPAGARAAIAARVAADEVPAVRFAAAAALCLALPEGRDEVLAALGPAGLGALRVLAAAPVAPGSTGAAVAAARCLAADPDPRSQRAWVQLRHGAPPAVRAAVGRAR